MGVLSHTGRYGENRADVRVAIVDRLSLLGEFAVEVVPAREELVIARAVRDVIED